MDDESKMIIDAWQGDPALRIFRRMIDAGIEHMAYANTCASTEAMVKAKVFASYQTMIAMLHPVTWNDRQSSIILDFMITAHGEEAMWADCMGAYDNA